MANFTRIGYGQVEPNQLSGIKTGQLFASLPLDSNVKVLQQGEYMYYDGAAHKVTATPTVEGMEPFMVYQEIKIYESYLSYKDFAMIRVGDNYVTHRPFTGAYGDGAENIGASITPGHTEYGYRMDGICPRLVKTNIGDIYTTNMVATGVEYNEGDVLKLKKNVDSNTLVLDKTGDIETIQFVVNKVYTMPDGQPGLKIQRIK